MHDKNPPYASTKSSANQVESKHASLDGFRVPPVGAAAVFVILRIEVFVG